MEQAGDQQHGDLTIADVQMEEQTNYNFNVTVVPEPRSKFDSTLTPKCLIKIALSGSRGISFICWSRWRITRKITVGELELVTESEKADIETF